MKSNCSPWATLTRIGFALTFAITTNFAAEVTWTGGSGDWDTTNNWSTGALPGPDDDVVIDRPGDITVTHSSGTHSVKSLLCQEAFVLSGGSLTVSNTVQVNNGFSLPGGTLAGGTVLQGTNGQPITVTSGTLDGVSLASDVSLANNTILSITNGLTLVGGVAITLNSAGFIVIDVNPGTQMIGGTGQIVLAGTSDQNYLRLGNGGTTTLTLGPNVTVRGQGSIMQAQSGSMLVNQGTIQADVSGQTLGVSLSSFTNSGTLRALNGGTLSLSGNWNNSGIIHASSGGTVSISGSYSLAGGTLNVGINSATDYGRINFTGPLTASGEFTVGTINGFRPNPGDTFTVLTYASATNEFACYSGLDLGGGLFLVPHFGKTRLTLTAATYTTNTTQPQLFISRSLTGVRIVWPLGFTNWELQTTTNLSSPVWGSVSAQCDNQAVVPAPAPAQYFRLRHGN